MDRTRIEIADGIAWITLDDGKVNAMSIEMMAELNARLDQAAGAKAVTVIEGRAGIFSAGFDLGTFRRGPDEARRMVRDGALLVERLLTFPEPVLTACTGHAYPMGAFLMLAADVRLGISGPYQIGMNEVAIGLTIPLFAVEIARHRLTPPGFARLTTAAMFDPQRAAELGYLDEVVAPDVLTERARAEATRLTTLDRDAFRATKARTTETAARALRGAIERELV